MDFHAALETFAEAWVAANTQTAVNSEPGSIKHTSLDELPTMLPKDQLSTTQEIQDNVCNKINHGNDVGGQRSKCNTPSNQMAPIEKSSSCTTSPAIVSSSLSQKTTSLKSPNHKKPELMQTQSGTRSLPIHCVIEQMNGAVNFDNATSAPCDMCAVELDSYAILPATTPLHELVRTALTKLGYSSADAVNAKGAIQLKNWKPLSFDIITDDKTTTVDDILGELINSATLRIRLSSQPKLSSAEEMKAKLLQLLLTHSHSLLIESGCPIEKTLLMSISKGETSSNMPEDLRIAFDVWYNNQIKKSKKDYTDNDHITSSTIAALTTSNDDPEKVEPDQPSPLKLEPELQNLSADSSASPKRTSLSSSSSSSSSLLIPSSLVAPHMPGQLITNNSVQPHQHQQSLHSHLQGTILTPSKTRIRTSFDPEHEIPRLQRWFHDNQHPTREQMVRYMSELNSLDSRKGRRALDLTNIIYWFKNARAAQRRASKALDDSFENEENMDISNGHTSLIPSSQPESPQAPPFLPNKNAVYVIPFPYHSPHATHPHHMLSAQTDVMLDIFDEPCDLSVKKVKERFSPNHIDTLSGQNSRSKSDKCSLDIENGSISKNSNRKSSPVMGYCSTKDNQRIREEDAIEDRNPVICNGFPSLVENSSPRKMTGFIGKELQTNGQHEDRKLMQKHYVSGKSNESIDKESLHSPDIKEEYISEDEDNESIQSDDSSNSGRLKIQEEGEDEVDYSGSQSRREIGLGLGMGALGVTAASAANMAALSLAQMSQPLHIPQLPPHLAMYYPMAPRYYPPPHTHHSQTSAAAAMVAALNSSAHYSSVTTTTTTTNNNSSSHHSSNCHPIPIQPSPHTPLSTSHGQSRSSEPRKRRTRVFIDPLTEIPKLEKWFVEDTHPSAYMIDKYTDALNAAEYRQKFPKLEPKNIQLWFKNHRAKVKRMRMGLGIEDSFNDSPPSLGGSHNSPVHSGLKDEGVVSSPDFMNGSRNDDRSPSAVVDNGDEEELVEEGAQ